MIKKLAEIANELDAAGYTDLADRLDVVVDTIAKQAAATSLAPADMRSPEWVAAVDKAMPFLMQSYGWIYDKTPPGSKAELVLVRAIAEIKRICNANKAKQQGQVK